MKNCYGSFRAAQCIGLATMGAAVFGIAVFGIALLGTTSTAEAQKQGTAAETKKESTYAALAEAPEKARQRKNPFEGDPQALAAGGKLFQQHCAECHGEKAGGARKGPSLLHEEVKQATPGTLFWILSNGVVRRGMPVWSKLPEQQRWQIVTFLQSLKPESPESQPGNDAR
jgi:mono/diheme cytochrome c family protein